MKFELGPGVRCDLTKLIDTRALIQANSGGGKSHTLRRLLEQTHGRVQQLVIDPEGEFSSLREKYDYVLAARHGGDTAADPRAAKLLAERLLELNVSAILDIYELKAHERIKFVRHFLEALVDAPKHLWHPALVVVDEAHVFCPQQGEAESAGAVIDLCTRGRKRGFCAVLATQRLSKLHKDAAAELNNKLIGRTGLDVDRKRAGEELGFTTKEQLLSLRQLAPGHFYAFGPALSPAVTQVQVGDVQTTHPKAGARIASAAAPPTEKVKALLPQLADLPKEAEERTKTLQDLQRENADLRRRNTQLERAAPARVETKVETKVERVEVPILKDAQVGALGRLADRLEKLAQGLGEVVENIRTAANAIHLAVMEANTKHRPPIVDRQAIAEKASVNRQLTIDRPAPRPVQTSAPRRPPASRPQPPADGTFRPTGSQQRTLDALAWLEGVGFSPADRAQLALVSNQPVTSGGYKNNLGTLRTAGLIEYPSTGDVALTDAGRALANASGLPTSVEEFQQQLFRRLPGSQVRILEVLIERYVGGAAAISRDELAEAAGQPPTSGGFKNNLGELRSWKLIDYPRPGVVVATPALFLERSR